MSSVVRRAPGVVARTVGGRVVLVLPSGARVLNEVASRVWELADGRALEAIVEALAREYEAPREAIVADVRRFLDELAAEGLVIVG